MKWLIFYLELFNAYDNILTAYLRKIYVDFKQAIIKSIPYKFLKNVYILSDERMHDETIFDRLAMN